MDESLDIRKATLDVLRDELERTRIALDAAVIDRLNEHGRAERAEAETAAVAARLTVAEAAMAEARALLDQRATELVVERARAATAEDYLRGEAAQERAKAADVAIRTATAEAEAKGLREALAEARRPFWRRWIQS